VPPKCYEDTNLIGLSGIMERNEFVEIGLLAIATGVWRERANVQFRNAVGSGGKEPLQRLLVDSHPLRISAALIKMTRPSADNRVLCVALRWFRRIGFRSGERASGKNHSPGDPGSWGVSGMVLPTGGYHRWPSPGRRMSQSVIVI